jgi:hypothetical protein
MMKTGLIIKLVSIVLLLIIVNLPLPPKGELVKAGGKQPQHQPVGPKLGTEVNVAENREIISRLDRQILLLEEMKQELKAMEKTSGLHQR